ncbi:MAG: hypothetical protein ACJ8AT_13910 [Hyalangium sp.]|uniref:hypothetical protein n=1 Tax=Hyalangium sp. TaxID=2028555 RepID=UPI00389A04D8
MQNDSKRLQTHRARPEALPYEWADLTEDQQAVAVEIHKYLRDFVSLPLGGKRPAGPFSWRPDPHRESNVILIDGSRGSGKTSVLLTVLELWLRVLRQEPTGKAPEEIVEWLQRGELAGKLIPLRVLDLQPLPQSTSLLTWLAGRLLELVDDLEGVDGTERGAPPAPIGSWNPKWEVELPSRKAWRELLQDAAIGWESNLSQRRKDLDPESYAVELGQAERARLSIQDRWREFVDRVAEDACQRLRMVKPDARFILSIDDADMNPHRCVELLDLLRTFWHPRLVFVLTGETDLFIKTLRLHYLGRFREALGSGDLSSTESVAIDSKPNALGLAWNAYNKAVPRGQRFSLLSLRPRERFKLLQQELDIPLRRTFEQLPPSNLAGYIELAPFLQRALPDRLRRLQDLRQRLSTSDLRKRAAFLVHELWQDSIRFSDLSSALQASLLESVQLRDEGLFVELPDYLSWESQSFKATVLPGSSNALRINIPTGFTYAPLPDEPPLPEPVTALLQLALNVAVDEVDGEMPDRSLPQGFDSPLASTVIAIGRGRKAEFAWPLPDWTTPLEFHLVMAAWTRQSLSSILSHKAPGALIGRFVSAVLSADARRRPDEQFPEDRNLWEDLAARISEALRRLAENSSSSPRQRRLDRWLYERVGLLAAPESGLPPSLANDFLGALLARIPSEFQSLLVSRLKTGRRSRAKSALDEIQLEETETPSTILQKIDEAHPSFDWGSRVEDRPSAVQGQDLTEALQKAMTKIPVHHHPASSAKLPESLKHYVDETLNLSTQFQGIPRERLSELVAAMERLASEKASASQALLTLWNTLIESRPPSEQAVIRVMLSQGEAGLQVVLPSELAGCLQDPIVRRAAPERNLEARNGIIWQLHGYLRAEDRASDELHKVLAVAYDIVADERDVDGSTASNAELHDITWGAALPGVSSMYLFRGKPVHIDWPVPRWLSFLDWHLTDQLWQRCRPKPMLILRASSNRTSLVRDLLYQMSAIANGRQLTTSSVLLWDDALQWIRTSPQKIDLQGTRWARIREWAEIGVLLFATPELGLPSQECTFLLGLLSTPVDPSRIEAIVAARRAWARRSLHLAGLDHDGASVARFLAEMDGLDPNHPWKQVIGADASHAIQFDTPA